MPAPREHFQERALPEYPSPTYLRQNHKHTIHKLRQDQGLENRAAGRPPLQSQIDEAGCS